MALIRCELVEPRVVSEGRRSSRLPPTPASAATRLAAAAGAFHPDRLEPDGLPVRVVRQCRSWRLRDLR